MSRLLTFPCYSIWTDQNDFTGHLHPIFCDGSFLWAFFWSDCSSEVVCTCCTRCLYCGQGDLQHHQQQGLYYKKMSSYIITSSNWLSFHFLVIITRYIWGEHSLSSLLNYPYNDRESWFRLDPNIWRDMVNGIDRRYNELVQCDGS
jgi:hypothetical protein